MTNWSWFIKYHIAKMHYTGLDLWQSWSLLCSVFFFIWNISSIYSHVCVWYIHNKGINMNNSKEFVSTAFMWYLSHSSSLLCIKQSPIDFTTCNVYTFKSFDTLSPLQKIIALLSLNVPLCVTISRNNTYICVYFCLHIQTYFVI
jgi:hypothetical protein